LIVTTFITSRITAPTTTSGSPQTIPMPAAAAAGTIAAATAIPVIAVGRSVAIVSAPTVPAAIVIASASRLGVMNAAT
jgi:hypothetical protein